MYFRTATLGTLAAAAVALAWLSAPTFTLQSTGAVALNASGQDARFGIVPQAVRGHHRDRALYLEALELIEDPERGALWRAAWLRDDLRAPRSICARAAALAAQLRAGEAPDW